MMALVVQLVVMCLILLRGRKVRSSFQCADKGSTGYEQEDAMHFNSIFVCLLWFFATLSGGASSKASTGVLVVLRFGLAQTCPTWISESRRGEYRETWLCDLDAYFLLLHANRPCPHDQRLGPLSFGHLCCNCSHNWAVELHIKFCDLIPLHLLCSTQFACNFLVVTCRSILQADLSSHFAIFSLQ